MSRRSIVIASALFCGLFFATAVLAADDPFTGTWKLNVEKSTRRSNYNPPKSLTYQLVLQGNVLKSVEDIVRIDGTVRHGEITAILDGQHHSITDNPNLDAYKANRIDPRTIVVIATKGGNEVLTDRYVISDDSKTMTLTRKERNDQGQEISYISICDKQ